MLFVSIGREVPWVPKNIVRVNCSARLRVKSAPHVGDPEGRPQAQM
jgi:hypothetical protein